MTGTAATRSPWAFRLAGSDAATAAAFAVAVAAWITLATTAASEGHLLFCGHADFVQLSLRLDALVAFGVPGAELRGWTLMVVAMMVPVAAPMIRFVHARSAWRRRGRSATLFTAGYVGAWLAAGCVLVPLILVLSAFLEMTGTRLAATGIAFAGAALFQLTDIRARALNRCHGTMPLRTYGVAADRDALSFGMVHAARCARACWPAMGALAVAGHSLPAMLLVTTAIVRERRAFRPSGVEAAWLVLVAGGVSLLAA